MKTSTLALLVSAALLTGSCSVEPVPLVKAAFSFSPEGGCKAPCEIAFTNATENTGIYEWRYQWNFGDDSSSDAINPTHRFTSPGVYSVVLTVSGKYGFDTISRDVTVSSPAPTAGFTMVGTPCTAPCEVTFTNTSANAASYAWTFGDGGTSTAPSPAHTYTTAGAFPVTLTATGPGGSAARKDTVHVGSPASAPLKAVFAVTPVECETVPCDVTFNDLSTGKVAARSWNFGDDTPPSTQKTPVHRYQAAGTYTVTLTVTGSDGLSDSISHHIKVPKDG